MLRLLQVPQRQLQMPAIHKFIKVVKLGQEYVILKADKAGGYTDEHLQGIVV